MARKPSTKRGGKPISSATAFRPRRKISALLSLVLILCTLGFGNWFAHLPSQRRASFGALERTFEKLGSVTADITDSIGLTGRDARVAYHKQLPTQTKFLGGQPVVEDPKKAMKDVVILKRKGYWVGWSPTCGHPLYVAYTIPKSKALNALDKRPPFAVDPEARACPAPEDYTRSGYDRGHMAPNYLIGTRYGKAAQKETFLMSNIVPQKPDLNRGPWKALEQIVADDLPSVGEVLWVITGPVPSEKRSYLKRGKVRIPKGFFKIIATVKDGELRALGLYMSQEERGDKQPRYCFVSIDAIEAMTGLNFFGELTEADQAILESVEPTRFWPKVEFFR